MIQKSLNFLKKEEVKNVPFDEKVQYLKGKLTEEELSEVLARFNDGDNKTKENQDESIKITTTASTVQRRESSSTSVPPKQYSSFGSKFISGINIAAISAVSSIGVSYLINNMKDKKEKEVFQCMKDFQDQSLNQIQNKLNELIEENNKLRSKMLTEADVKMIVAKAIDNRVDLNSVSTSESIRRKSMTNGEGINLQIKHFKNRFSGTNNQKNKQSLKDSTNSDPKKDTTSELWEQMNKFLKVSQEYNAEVMREMKSVNQNMAACFTSLTSALNKFSNKFDNPPAINSQPAQPTPKLARNITQRVTRTPSNATSASLLMKGQTAEETKQIEPKSIIEEKPKENNDDIIEEAKQATDSDPVIKDENGSKDIDNKQAEIQEVDDILKVGAEINKESEDNNTLIDSIINPESSPLTTEEVEFVVTEFSESLNDLDQKTKSSILRNLSGLFTMMKNNLTSDSFKVNLENRMLKQTIDFKRNEFVQFLECLGFSKINNTLYQVSNEENFKSVLNESDLVSILKSKQA